jgi:hypothetical protein
MGHDMAVAATVRRAATVRADRLGGETGGLLELPGRAWVVEVDQGDTF